MSNSVPEQPRIGLLIIGSELLSGKRQDSHMSRAIEMLGQRGLELSRCLFLGDVPEQITAELSRSMATKDIVFCFGGIGATPDDHTRAAAASAAGLALRRHEAAARNIEQRFGDAAYPQRIRMAELPEGCDLIPNPVNQIAGFSIGRHHFVPGFPQMAWPMLEWVLDNHYTDSFADVTAEGILTIPNATEGQLIEIMEDFVGYFPELTLSCLPHMSGDYRETELGVRGERGEVERGLAWLTDRLGQDRFEWQRTG